jgi:hypothetical protein
MNIGSGDLALLLSEDWTRDSHEALLRLIRAHWRGCLSKNFLRPS